MSELKFNDLHEVAIILQDAHDVHDVHDVHYVHYEHPMSSVEMNSFDYSNFDIHETSVSQNHKIRLSGVWRKLLPYLHFGLKKR